jgi:hypothetical protein
MTDLYLVVHFVKTKLSSRCRGVSSRASDSVPANRIDLILETLLAICLIPKLK